MRAKLERFLKKTIPLVVLSFAVVIPGGGEGLAAKANAKDSIKIGTVDMQLALQTVNAGKKARSSLESAFNKRKAELKKEENDIKKLQEEFQKQSLVMSEKARVKKQSELQERVMKFQEKLTRSQMEIQKQEQDLTAPILEKLRKIISDVATKDGYTVILEKNENNVLFSLDKDDLTKKVIDTYNKQNKS